MAMRAHYDAVVIGSGFGGAVTACRLAERGLSVAVLERGREWRREDFPRPGSPRERWFWDEGGQGLFEVVRSPRMSLLVAAGVGGGSLVYTNIQRRAPAEVFLERWPRSIDRAALDPYYDRVFEILSPSPAPWMLPKTARFEAAAGRLGVASRLRRPDLAIYWGDEGKEALNRFGALQTGCIRCGMCTVGCHVHAKNTLDLNYLRLAAQHGAEIFPLREADTIEPIAAGYRVCFTDHGRAGSRAAVTGTRVVLACGTIATNRLMLRARDRSGTLPKLSARLGEGFSDNGDFFGAVLGAGRVEPANGPTVTTLLDFSDQAYLVLEGGLPDFLAARLERPVGAVLAAWRVLRRLGAFVGLADAPAEPAGTAFDSLLPLFLMGRDAADGRLTLDAHGELSIEWNHRRSFELFGRMRRHIRELGQALDGLGLPSPDWLLRRRLLGVHPLGGCALADSPERGVVNGSGEVFGYPRLYVADGSIIPTSLGVPPSMTIAALAERIAEGIP